MTTNWDSLLGSFSSTTFGELRPRQRELLDAYSAANGDDIAIELPTGGGKTLIGLLLAEHHLQAGQRVAYLTGNNHLSDQVVDEARELPGFQVARFAGGSYGAADLAAYNDAQSLGVMNYWVYFNSHPRVETADVLILDDAHLAEQPIAGMFSIRIDARSDGALYDQICDLVLAHSNLYPSVELMRERSAGSTTAPELLAFSDLKHIAAPLMELLSQPGADDDRRYVLPRIRPSMHACGLLIGPSAIELRPYTPPAQTLQQMSRTTRRIYMSATLGTMDDLQRRLGVRPPVPLQTTASQHERLGDRAIIINPTDAPALSEELLDFVLRQAHRAGRVAWLCASHDEADRLEAKLVERRLVTYRLRSGGDDRVQTRWAADATGHLVTAGRFDGMDFADSMCRLVVLPSLPAASTEFERFVMAYLGDATYMRHRVGQRVTQALGRANRTADDWAMYIAAGPEFSTMLAGSAVQAEIPASIRAELAVALARIEGSWEAAEADAARFWDEHDGAAPPPAPAPSGDSTDQPAPRRRPGRAASAAASSGSATDEVTAVTRMWLGDYLEAAAHATAASDALTAVDQPEHAAFWKYVAAQAQWQGDVPGLAIESLRAAVSATQNTAWFVRLRRVLASLTAQQLREDDEQPWASWDEWLRTSGRTRAERAVAGLATAWSGTHDQQAAALETVGRLTGAATSRPVGNAVTDAIWNFVSGRTVERRLWEVKTGNPDRVPRDWVDQNIGQVVTDRTTSGRIKVSGCILTHLTEAEPEAVRAARDTSTFVTTEAMEALTAELTAVFGEYTRLYGSGTTDERSTARTAVEPRMPSSGWLTRLFVPGAFVTRDDVRAVFPR